MHDSKIKSSILYLLSQPGAPLKFLLRSFWDVGDFMNQIGVGMREASLRSEEKECLRIQDVTMPL